MNTDVVILSKERDLSQYLANYFTSLGCSVEIFTNSKSLSQGTKHLIVINFNAAFAKDGGLIERIEKYAPKVVALNDVWSTDLPAKVAMKHLYVDQLLPIFKQILFEIYSESQKSHIFLPAEAWVSVLTLKELADKVASELFSFPTSRKILFGKLISFRELVGYFNPSAVVSINRNSPKRLPRRDLEITETTLDIRSLPWNELFYPKPTPKQTRPKPKRLMVKIATPPLFQKSAVALAAVVFVLISAPYILLLGAAGSTYVAYKFFQDEKIQSSVAALGLSRRLSALSSNVFKTYGFLPLEHEAELLALGTMAAGRVLSASDYATSLSEESIKALHLELDSLYRDLSFIDGEVKTSPRLISRFFPEAEKIAEYRSYVLAASRLSMELPSILGFDRPKTYMVLFQNNMELRPTGGFIGSFALLTISKGEIIDDTVYDVYSADGQLKGYIKPPLPIDEHLGEASWTMRDSNWDPDFNISAERAEWFLDKSMDRQVDGVVAVNLETAKEFLKVLGPVTLMGFGDKIDYKNMYEKVQFEVENSFFPGSRKKAQYLSALSEALLSRIENANSKEYAKLLVASIQKIYSRDIQMYFHDDRVSNVLAEQGWEGGMPQGNFSGIVEANLGVNKANYFVNREVNVALTIKDQSLTQEISLKLKNTAPTRDKIPEQRYKVYIRALSPNASHLLGARVLSRDGEEDPDVDIVETEGRVEYGTLVEVLPSEEKIITFRINTPLLLNFTNVGNFGYTWWKQSGTGEYPFNISVAAPAMGGTNWNPPFRLTEEGTYRYNTNLVGDFNLNLNWTAK